MPSPTWFFPGILLGKKPVLPKIPPLERDELANQGSTRSFMKYRSFLQNVGIITTKCYQLVPHCLS